MMQVIGALDAVLLRPSETELASSADPTRKPDADETADLDVLATARAQCNDAPNALVAADVWELYVRYWAAVWPGGGSRFGMEICHTASAQRSSVCPCVVAYRSGRHQCTEPLLGPRCVRPLGPGSRIQT